MGKEKEIRKIKKIRTCMYFNSEEQRSLHCTKYWIVSSKTGNNTKECKVLELHQCGTGGITVQITRIQKL